MRAIRKACSYAIVTAVSTSVMASGATAACANIAGTWHVFLMEGDVASTTTTSVRKGDDSGSVTIKVFRNNVPSSATSLAIKCKLTLAPNGAFNNAPCKSYGIVASDGGPATVSGQIIFAADPACQIAGGNLTVDEDPTPVTFLGGYVNPMQKHGAGIARQGPGSVFLFNMVKQ